MIYLVLSKNGDDFGVISKFKAQVLEHLSENDIELTINNVSDKLDAMTELMNGTIEKLDCLRTLETFTFQCERDLNLFKEGFESANTHAFEHYVAFIGRDKVDMREIQHTVSFIGTEEQIANLDLALGISDNDLPRRLNTTHTDQSLCLAMAIAGNGVRHIEKSYIAYLDEHGYLPIYEMLNNISDKLLLSDDSEYQKFLRADNKDNYFGDTHNTCMDWYFIEEAKKLIDEELKGWENELPKQKSNDDPYYLFITLELGRSFGILNADTEYDNLWADALILREEFIHSEYNVESKSEYDCISDFCQNYVQDMNTKKKDEIEKILINIWARIPMDTPENYEDIVQFCFEDVCETADKDNWGDGDVAIAFRRWVENVDNMH